jgi:hypothetical protein
MLVSFPKYSSIVSEMNKLRTLFVAMFFFMLLKDLSQKVSLFAHSKENYAITQRELIQNKK